MTQMGYRAGSTNGSEHRSTQSHLEKRNVILFGKQLRTQQGGWSGQGRTKRVNSAVAQEELESIYKGWDTRTGFSGMNRSWPARLGRHSKQKKQYSCTK